MAVPPAPGGHGILCPDLACVNGTRKAARLEEALKICVSSFGFVLTRAHIPQTIAAYLPSLTTNKHILLPITFCGEPLSLGLVYLPGAKMTRV